MGILDLLFPIKCLGCGAPPARPPEGRGYICQSCFSKVSRVKLVCPYCERPSIDGMTHAKCKRVFGLDGLVSAFRYEGVIRKAILALKYKYATEIVNELRSYLVTELENKKKIFGESVVLSPIPLHWYRGNYRGFNQSEIIGKEVARILGWKFVPDLLLRKRLTRPQTELKGNRRRQNIRGVFTLNPKYLSLVSYRLSLVIFDDVFTTGSTLKEAASVLKRKGARDVWGLTIAR